jgi:hypothetical protein
MGSTSEKAADKGVMSTLVEKEGHPLDTTEAKPSMLREKFFPRQPAKLEDILSGVSQTDQRLPIQEDEITEALG